MSSKLPRSDSIEELARFWDSHDVTEFEDELVDVGEPVFVRGKARILGQGENALTYWAIASRLPRLLKLLHDDTEPRQTTILYRPSFGRPAGAHDIRAGFGDFDAIVGTKTAVYLIESKCSRLPVSEPAHIKLGDTKIRRNSVFRWYHQHWTHGPDKAWTQFVAERDPEFRQCFPGVKLASASSHVARNLRYVLRCLADCGRRVEEVLLFFHPEHPNPIAPTIEPPSIRLVLFPFPASDNVAFVRMTA